MPTPRFHGRVPVPQAFSFSDLPVVEPQLSEILEAGFQGSAQRRAKKVPKVVVPTTPPVKDVKTILSAFRNDWTAAVLRHEIMMTQMLRTQKEIQQDMARVRSAANSPCADAQVKLQSYGFDLCDEIDSFPPPAVLQAFTPENTSRRDAAAASCKPHADEHPHAHQQMATETCEHDLPDSSITHHMSSKAKNVLGLNMQRHTWGSDVRYTDDEDDPSLRARLDRMMGSKEFELMLAFSIVLNAFIICFESQYYGLDVGFKLHYPGRLKQAYLTWPGAETVFEGFDWIFGVLFLVELMMKIACWQLSYFHDYWNVLDCLCVLSFLVDKIVAANAINPMPLRLLRLFRLARLVRLIRFLEHLEALYVMTTAIGGLIKILGWAIFLLTVMLLTCDLFLVQLLQATYFSDINVDEFTEDQLKKHQNMYEYFGTSTRCLLSMFEITLGNWPPIARLLCEEVSEWFILLCLVHKLTLGFAVLGVINGVILQETFKVAQTDDIIMLRQKKKASEATRVKMSKLFCAMDSDSDGKVTQTEFLQMCEDPDVKTWLSSLDIETDDLPNLFNLLDINRNGCLSLDEVVTQMPRIKGAARSIDLLSLLQKKSLHY